MPTLHDPDNALLHRAHACMRNSPEPEVTVFFEALPLTDPGSFLQHLLAPIWGCRPADVDVALLCSADYLLRHWTRGHADTGDARLFEVGFGADGTIHYLAPERTMLLVPPAQLQRLVKAQRAADELARAGYREPDADDADAAAQVQRDAAAARCVA